MYYFYLDKILLPVPPEKLELKIKNQNKTMNLINNNEINIIKAPGLTEVSFDILLPNFKYPFAIYKSNYQPAKYFLEEIEKLKTNMKPFQFIVSRRLPNKNVIYDTNMKVTLEEYTITEEAKEGFDVKVKIKLKQYMDYSTKTMKIEVKQNKNVAVKTNSNTRPATTAPSVKTYTVQKGDCLWNIAKKYYGNGSQYMRIYEANRNKIKKPSLIYPGQVLVIP